MRKFAFCLLTFAIIFIARADAQKYILPIELANFNYQLVDSTVLLTWETITEINNVGFYVERYSYQDSSWLSLDFVVGATLSNSPKYYSYTDTSVLKGTTYLYRLKQVDNNGDYKYSDTLTVAVITGIKNIKEITPAGFSVSQNYPNPFNPSTNIQIALFKSSGIKLKVYNSLGRIIKEENYGEKSAGIYTISINMMNFSSGIYYYEITAGNFSQTHSMILLK